MSAVTLFGRQVVRSTPYGAQYTKIMQTLADGAFFTVEFDLALAVSDRNQLADNGAGLSVPVAIGPTLDVTGFSDHVGILEVFVIIDAGGSQLTLTGPQTVTANVPFYIQNLRIPGRLPVVHFTNTGGASATVEFGVFVRSN